MKKTSWLLILLALSIALMAPIAAFAANPVPPLTLSFGTNSVTVAGLSLHASVYAFSLAREPQGGYQKIVPREILLTESGGQAVWTLPNPVPLRSVWFFVDLSTGAYAAGAPAGYNASRFALTDAHLKKDIAGDVDHLACTGTLVEFVVVRPGVGAWNALLTYRETNDDATEHDKITLSLLNLQPALTNTDPVPKKLKKDDVVFLVDSFTATYGAARIGE